MINKGNIFILGNAGSGKTHIAREISKKYGIEWLNLDHISFASQHYKEFLTLEEREEKVLHYIETHKNGFIIEGVYEDLLLKVEDKIDTLIFLNLDWKECKLGLEQRSFDPLMTNQQEHNKTLPSFLNYAKSYFCEDGDDSCLHIHNKVFNESSIINKIEICSRKEMDDFISKFND